jgi:hypothetical protein
VKIANVSGKTREYLKDAINELKIYRTRIVVTYKYIGIHEFKNNSQPKTTL